MINFKLDLMKLATAGTGLEAKQVATVIEYLFSKEIIDRVRLRDGIVRMKYNEYNKAEGIKQKTIVNQLCTDFELSFAVVSNIVYYKDDIF